MEQTSEKSVNTATTQIGKTNNENNLTPGAKNRILGLPFSSEVKAVKTISSITNVSVRTPEQTTRPIRRGSIRIHRSTFVQEREKFDNILYIHLETNLRALVPTNIQSRYIASGAFGHVYQGIIVTSRTKFIQLLDKLGYDSKKVIDLVGSKVLYIKQGIFDTIYDDPKMRSDRVAVKISKAENDVELDVLEYMKRRHRYGFNFHHVCVVHGMYRLDGTTSAWCLKETEPTELQWSGEIFENPAVIVMELLEGTPLFDLAGSLSHKDMQWIFFGILEGVAEIHKHGLVHRDIKAENILVDVEKKQVKLVDFGLARVLKEGNRFKDTTLIGAAGSIAYEIVQAYAGRSTSGYDHKVDIWSTGVLLYTMLTEYPYLFVESEEEVQMENPDDMVTEWNYIINPSDELDDTSSLDVDEEYLQGLREYWIDDVPPLAKDLIKRMLCLNADKRPSANDLLNDTWFVNVPRKSKSKTNQSGKASPLLLKRPEGKNIDEDNGTRRKFSHRGSIPGLFRLRSRQSITLKSQEALTMSGDYISVLFIHLETNLRALVPTSSRGRFIASGAFGHVYQGIITTCSDDCITVLHELKIDDVNYLELIGSKVFYIKGHLFDRVYQDDSMPFNRVAVKLAQAEDDLELDILEFMKKQDDFNYERVCQVYGMYRIEGVTETWHLEETEEDCLWVKGFVINPAVIIMELLKGESLFDIADRISVSDVQWIFYGVLEGVKELHRHGLVHRDIKAENIHVHLEDKEVKIIDFGLARFLQPGEKIMDRTMIGAPGSIAYEIIQAYDGSMLNGYDSKVDIWSVGVMIYTILTQYPYLFTNTDEDELQMENPQDMVMEWNYVIDPSIRTEDCSALDVDPEYLEALREYWIDDIPITCRELIIEMLKFNPEERPNASGALTHKWFEHLHREAVKTDIDGSISSSEKKS